MTWSPGSPPHPRQSPPLSAAAPRAAPSRRPHFAARPAPSAHQSPASADSPSTQSPHTNQSDPAATPSLQNRQPATPPNDVDTPSATRECWSPSLSGQKQQYWDRDRA